MIPFVVNGNWYTITTISSVTRASGAGVTRVTSLDESIPNVAYSCQVDVAIAGGGQNFAGKAKPGVGTAPF